MMMQNRKAMNSFVLSVITSSQTEELGENLKIIFLIGSKKTNQESAFKAHQILNVC